MKVFQVVETAGRSLMLAIASLAVLVSPVALQAQISVDELEVYLRPDLAEQKSGVIRVTNHADKATQVLVELQDWDRDSTGANRFHKLGTLAESCRQKLRVFPMALRIEANATEPVRISFVGDATEGCWGIVFLQTNEPPTPGSRSQITYIIRTGIKVYVEPRNLLKQGDVEEVALTTSRASETDSTQVPALAVVFRNTGRAHLRPKGSVEVRNQNNEVQARVAIADFPVTPGGVRRVVAVLPKLVPGRYVALALLDYSGPEIAAGQYEFEVH